MLKNKLITFKFFKFIQSGFYIDFIIKKLIEIPLRNILIYSSIFFGEKYIIEFFTKKIIDKFTFNNNNILFNFSEIKYFTQIIYIFSALLLITIFILILI